jgi:polyferredoxin
MMKKNSEKRATSCPVCVSMNNKIKKFDICDIQLIKFSSMAFILFLITLWPLAMNLVQSISWIWWLLLVFIFGFKPMKKTFFS